MSYASEDPTTAFGLDISCTDGPASPPQTQNFTSSDQVHSWFSSHPAGSAPAIRLLCLPRTDGTVFRDATRELSTWQANIPFAKQVMEHALWNPKVYLDFAANRTGGCAALLDEPWRFILQTPADNEPFCSLAMSRHGVVIKGICLYDDDSLDPKVLLENESIQSGWRATGLQIISLPQAIAKANALHISRKLFEIQSEVAKVEVELLYSGGPTRRKPQSLYTLARALQSQSAVLVELERRARFQKQIIAAIESVTAASRHGSSPWPPLAPIKSQMESWEFDFQTAPKRIDNARGTITTLIQQRNEETNLEIAESSRRMTEAAMQDSASMKTIAILTMVFLPGTAVASFFSMSMFDWSAESGSGLASRWVWVFFVVATPLTGLVLLAWYLWGKRKEREALMRFRTLSSETAEVPLQDHDGLSDDMEMHTVRPSSKVDG